MQNSAPYSSSSSSGSSMTAVVSKDWRMQMRDECTTQYDIIIRSVYSLRR
jgi:hypothetical protein